MKISLEWLADFVTFSDEDPQKIAAAITAHTAEVDEVEVQGELLENCCVGKIIKLDKHPNADKLSLCEVLTDKGSQIVVCGGTNLHVGMRVAFAHVGASVRSPDGDLFTLESIEIRGEKSNGMICASSELELEDLYPPTEDQGKKPVIDLGPCFAKASKGKEGDEDVGKPLREVLGLNTTVLHIDNHAITHRADLFSHFGFARECVAMGIATWKKTPEFPSITFTEDALPFKIHVDAASLVPRYSGCLLSIDGLGETPDWMKRRLAATGWRSVDLPIDITNYVIMEMGQPMHSFDADDLEGELHIRTSKEGESITTLDNTERELPDGALVISDDKGIFDLLGIMGGLRSSTKESTKRIFLQAATLDPVTIRRGILATGHRTDGSTVYEKGVPACFSEPGLKRAVQLALELVPGAKVISSLENWGDNGTAKPIDLFVERVEKLLGVEISQKEITKILTDLEFEVSDKGKGVLSVTPPLFRLGDISGAHDLIEEVGRIYGLDKIPVTMPDASITPPNRDMRVHIMRDALADQNYLELCPLSLIGNDLLKKCSIETEGGTEIENPLGAETGILAPYTLPALLEHAENNMLIAGDVLRTFFESVVFKDNKDDHREIGMLVAAKSKTDLKTDPFLIAKQDLEEALGDAGYALSIDLCKDIPPFAHSGRCANLLVGEEVVGTIFEVHPDVRGRFDIPGRAAAVQLNLTKVLDRDPTASVFQELPTFPAVSYDTTVAMSADKKAGDLLNKIENSSDLLESVEIADLYGEGDSYNLTLRCTYRAADRTLKEEEAKQAFASVETLLLS